MRPEIERDEIIKKIPAVNAENVNFVNGDHWQGGLGYSGPLLPSDNPLYNEWLTNMERIFVYRDVLMEIRRRDRQALTGRSWTWVVVDSEGQPVEGDEEVEINRVMRKWIKERRVMDAVGDAIESASWAGEDGSNGRGVLRFYIRASEIDGDGYVKPENIEEALSIIAIESPSAVISGVVADNDTNYQDLGILDLSDEEGEEYLEICYLEEGSTKEESVTVIENVDEGDMVEVLLRGELTMYEIRRALLIDGAQRSMQKMLNHIMTAFQAAIGGAGWPEDFFFGLLPPGEWDEDSDGNLVFSPEPLARGPGRSHFMQQVTTVTLDNEEKAVGSAGHVQTSPVSPYLFTSGVEAVRSEMLSQASQEYTLLTGLAQASGEKLQLAKGDFETSVNSVSNEVAHMVSWVLRVAYAMAENLLDSEPSGFDFIVDIQIDMGIVTIEQEMMISQLVMENFISHETGLAKAGYSNPAKERRQVEDEMAELVDEAGAGVSSQSGGESGEGVAAGVGGDVGAELSGNGAV